MQATLITRDDLNAAIAEANRYYDGNITLRGSQSTRDGIGFRFAVNDATGPGAKVTGKGYGKPRRSVNACWHVHRDVFAAIYEQNDKAKISSVVATYNNLRDFLTKFPATGYQNIGSPAFPILNWQSCDCQLPEDEQPTDGPIVTKLRAIFALTA